MAHTLIPLNIPVRLQCVRVPVRWRYEVVRDEKGKETLLLDGECDFDEPASTFDIWEKRAEFFRLKEGDHEALRTFLDGVGMFTYPVSTWEALGWAKNADKKAIESMRQNFRYFDAEDGSHMIWGDFKRLRSADIWSTRKRIIREMAEHIPDPRDFLVRLASLKSGTFVGPAAMITTYTFQDALSASVRVDHLLRAKKRKCQRPDCGIPFAAVGPRKRKFCSWYCGHIMSVRRGRKPGKGKL